jgi:hypothetical protein
MTQMTERGYSHQSPLRKFILESLGENAVIRHLRHSGTLGYLIPPLLTIIFNSLNTSGLGVIFAKVGPANVTLSAWVASPAELDVVVGWVKDNRVASLRLILDLLVQSREPEAAALMRHVFGADKVAFTRNHARFALVETAEHRLVVRSSADLTNNPSFELHSVEDDPGLFVCLSAFCDDVFTAHVPTAAVSRLEKVFAATI